MNENDDIKFLKKAILQSKKSIEKGGFPAGAIVVKNGKIIATGISIGNILNDPTSHSETSSIRKACQKLKTNNLSGAVLYASLRPCMMCFSVANWAGIAKIVYACRKEMVKKEYYEGESDILNANKTNNREIEIKFVSNFENESLELVKKWESMNK